MPLVIASIEGTGERGEERAAPPDAGDAGRYWRSSTRRRSRRKKTNTLADQSARDHQVASVSAEGAPELRLEQKREKKRTHYK